MKRFFFQSLQDLTEQYELFEHFFSQFVRTLKCRHYIHKLVQLLLREGGGKKAKIVSFEKWISFVIVLFFQINNLAYL